MGPEKTKLIDQEPGTAFRLSFKLGHLYDQWDAQAPSPGWVF